MIDLGDLTTRNAWRSPRRDAIIDVPNGRRLSFAQLEERANRLANGLRGELGLAPGDRVAILSTNAAEIAETFFACAQGGPRRHAAQLAARRARAGADPCRRRARGARSPTRSFADDRRSSSSAATTSTHWIEFTPGAASPYEDLLARSAADAPPWSAETGGDDPFFILFTGGTTGTSKGALHSHASCFAAMVNQAVAERIADDDVYMLLGQMFHIPVVLAMTYLAHGRPLVLMNFEPRKRRSRRSRRSA